MACLWTTECSYLSAQFAMVGLVIGWDYLVLRSLSDSGALLAKLRLCVESFRDDTDV